MTLNAKPKKFWMTADAIFNVTCWGLPLQIQGKCEGVNFYFRARHGSWQLHVSTNPALSIEELIHLAPAEIGEGIEPYEEGFLPALGVIMKNCSEIAFQRYGAVGV